MKKVSYQNPSCMIWRDMSAKSGQMFLREHTCVGWTFIAIFEFIDNFRNASTTASLSTTFFSLKSGGLINHGCKIHIWTHFDNAHLVFSWRQNNLFFCFLKLNRFFSMERKKYTAIRFSRWSICSLQSTIFFFSMIQQVTAASTYIKLSTIVIAFDKNQILQKNGEHNREWMRFRKMNLRVRK